MLPSRILARIARLGSATPANWGAAFSTQVVVPPLGDSISEGSISALLKQAGDKVQENDVIAQIETDKVTIDIKAPKDGTVLGLLVKVDDTVTPGQLIAMVDEAPAPGGLLSAAPAATAAPGAPPTPVAAATAAAAGAPPHRVAGIQFPPRVTPDGQRISGLPAAEAASWAQRLAGAVAAAAAAVPSHAASVPAPSQPQAHGAHHPVFPVSPMVAAVGRTARAKVVPTRLKEQPQRSRLTDKELEAIMLGGAVD